VPNRFLLDVDPLRGSRDFRLLFAGQMVSMLGSQLTVVAIPFQIYALTRSSLQVGAVSLSQLLPLVSGALVGGSLGDAFDRRRILAVSLSLLSLTSTALAVNATLARPSVLAIYLISAAAAGLGGVVSTTCQAAVPALVERRHLVAAYASMQVVDQIGMVAGPALSGLLIGAIHLPWVYALDAISFILMAVATTAMAATRRAPGYDRSQRGSVLEGLRYLRGRQALQGAYLIDLSATVFGLPRALFPALAATVFHGGAGTLGYLYAAPGGGALLGALTTGWLARVRRQAGAVIIAVCAWGTAVVLFGLVHGLWAALALLAIAGWMDVISAVLRTTILQTSVSEAFRARISSVQIAVVEGGPRLGDIESGAIATAVSTQFAVISGGLACIGGAVLLAGLLPGFRRYRANPQPERPPDPGRGEVGDAREVS
jgi:MFS family permease